MTTVSHAGRRRGRGKGASKKIAKDLNKGQVIGIGKKNVIWPGLNAPILNGISRISVRYEILNSLL